MAYIFSTDILKHGKGGGSPRNIRDFVSINAGGAGKYLGICSKLRHKANLLKTVILGYDSDENKLAIISSPDGDITVSNKATTQRINCTKFLTAVGILDKYIGRYEAHMENGIIVVELNKPLPEDEQSKKKK